MTVLSISTRRLTAINSLSIALSPRPLSPDIDNPVGTLADVALIEIGLARSNRHLLLCLSSVVGTSRERLFNCLAGVVAVGRGRLGYECA